jgi:hypothetical protein
MADRYTRKDAEFAATWIVKALGEEMYKEGEPKAGQWRLDWAPTYGGGMLERFTGEGWNISHPLWGNRMNAREWMETFWRIRDFMYVKEQGPSAWNHNARPYHVTSGVHLL